MQSVTCALMVGQVIFVGTWRITNCYFLIGRILFMLATWWLLIVCDVLGCNMHVPG